MTKNNSNECSGSAKCSDTPTVPGTLYVVSTPIGNLQDLSLRARRVLESADIVLAEDTRSFRRLGIGLLPSAELLSFYEHNESRRVSQTLKLLSSKKVVALVSEAGTPAISDPGFRLIRACRQTGISVTAVPGPSAVIAALSISGVPSERFYFEGFLPTREGKKRSALRAALLREVTTVFYESPYRIRKTLGLLAELAPQCEVFVARELTKLYEESFTGTALVVAKVLAEHKSLKGEFVLIIAPRKGVNDS